MWWWMHVRYAGKDSVGCNYLPHPIGWVVSPTLPTLQCCGNLAPDRPHEHRIAANASNMPLRDIAFFVFVMGPSVPAPSCCTDHPELMSLCSTVSVSILSRATHEPRRNAAALKAQSQPFPQPPICTALRSSMLHPLWSLPCGSELANFCLISHLHRFQGS
jgi:hypothetical protein